jgi:hypothetical protein
MGGAGGSGGAGGGISATDPVVLTGSLLQANSAGRGGVGGSASGGPGGGVAGTSGTGGPASGGTGGRGGFGGDGGAIVGSTISATNTTLTGNGAGIGGAGGSAAGGNGGGAPDSGGKGGNGSGGSGGRGGEGGAVWLAGAGSSTILHATIASNRDGGAGVGGAATGGNGGHGATAGTPGTASSGSPGTPGIGGATSTGAADVTLQNSIVASNSIPACAGTLTDGGHNIAFADPGCPGSAVDPLLEPLADNGGPTETMALGPGSPALDAVPSTGAACPPTDQRGVARPQGSACDIGAFEKEVPAQTTSTSGATSNSGPTASPPIATVARVTGVTLSPRAFRAAPSGPSALRAGRHLAFGTIVGYTLNQPAPVHFAVIRLLPGRHGSGGRCVAPSPSNHRAGKCTRLVAVRGAFTQSGAAGVNSFRFTGRIGGRRLSPGSYRLVLSPAATVDFRIITPA